MQKQTELSLNNPHFVRVKDNQVGLSQIFEWYASNFKMEGESFVEFINTYRKAKIDPASKVIFHPFDWSLNKME